MPDSAVDYHPRILKYTEKAVGVINRLPRLPSSTRRRSRIRAAVESGRQPGESHRNPSLLSAIEHHRRLCECYDNSLRQLEKELRIGRRKMEGALDEIRRGKTSNYRLWLEGSELAERVREMEKECSFLAGRKDETVGILETLRRMQETRLREYQAISTRSPVLKSQRSYIA